MQNCKTCEDFGLEDEKCHNRNSQNYDDFVNEYMVCVLWNEGKMKNYKRLCQLLGIQEQEKRYCGCKSASESSHVDCEDGCEKCKDYKKCLPELTPEKQLELIKYIYLDDININLSEKICEITYNLIKEGEINPEMVKEVIEQ